MKVAILVCALAAAAVAAPRYTRPARLDGKLAREVQAAEQAWSAAEAEADRTKQPALWERAAVAFDDVDRAPVDAKVKRAAAYAAVLAWKNALDVDPRVRAAPSSIDHDDASAPPRPLPAREQKLVGAFDRYAAYADPADPELPGLLFLKANLYRRYGHHDVAIPIFRTLVERYPRHEVAGFAASLLLDTYNRLQQYDRLVAFADQLGNDRAFLRDREDLAQAVAAVRRQARRKGAEALEATARTSADWGAYVAAARAYLEIYNADPDAPDSDEILFDAAVTFQEGRAIGEALRIYELIEQRAPKSRLAARALARSARLYGAVASYDRAADKLEQYARRYGGEKDAYDALGDAIRFRIALRDRARAVADTELFLKLFGAKKSFDAAAASWSLLALYDTDEPAARAHLVTYLRRFGEKGGVDRVVIAQARIGALSWKQSCPHALLDGLCVTAKVRTPPACGPGAVRTLTVTKRDAGTARRAHDAFAQAVAAFERTAGLRDDPAARHAYAEAKLALADADLEAYLAMEFPRGLDFDPARGDRARASAKRFATWLEAKRALGQAATRKYEAVFGIKDAAGAIAAASRLGTISLALARDLVTGAPPAGLGNGRAGAEARAAYCRALGDVAEPLEARAIDAFAVCLQKSTELGWFGEASARCERELSELAPEEFPRARELRAAPRLVAPVLAVEPPPR